MNNLDKYLESKSRKRWIRTGLLIYAGIQLIWFIILAIFSSNYEFPEFFRGILQWLLLIIGPPLVFLLFYFTQRVFAMSYGLWRGDPANPNACGPCGRTGKKGLHFDTVFICEKCLKRNIREKKDVLFLVLLFTGMAIIFLGSVFFESNLGTSSSRIGNTIVTTHTPLLEAFSGTIFAYLTGGIMIAVGILLSILGVISLLSPIPERDLFASGMNIIKMRDSSLG